MALITRPLAQADIYLSKAFNDKFGPLYTRGSFQGFVYTVLISTALSRALSLDNTTRLAAKATAYASVAKLAEFCLNCWVKYTQDLLNKQDPTYQANTASIPPPTRISAGALILCLTVAIAKRSDRRVLAVTSVVASTLGLLLAKKSYKEGNNSPMVITSALIIA